jgi:hypothetical protein
VRIGRLMEVQKLPDEERTAALTELDRWEPPEVLL